MFHVLPSIISASCKWGRNTQEERFLCRKVFPSHRLTPTGLRLGRLPAGSPALLDQRRDIVFWENTSSIRKAPTLASRLQFDMQLKGLEVISMTRMSSMTSWKARGASQWIPNSRTNKLICKSEITRCVWHTFVFSLCFGLFVKKLLTQRVWFCRWSQKLKNIFPRFHWYPLPPKTWDCQAFSFHGDAQSPQCVAASVVLVWSASCRSVFCAHAEQWVLRPGPSPAAARLTQASQEGEKSLRDCSTLRRNIFNNPAFQFHNFLYTDFFYNLVWKNNKILICRNLQGLKKHRNFLYRFIWFEHYFNDQMLILVVL